MQSKLKGTVKKPFLCSCGESNPLNFTGKMKSMCKICHAKDISRRMIEAREKAIEYKGGKCEHCGYDKFRGALEFHHKDPTQKDPQGLRKMHLGKLFAEVDKCVLLCANCHREEHARLRIGSVAELA
jgi:hypothetical protein